VPSTKKVYWPPPGVPAGPATATTTSSQQQQQQQPSVNSETGSAQSGKANLKRDT